MRSARAFMVLPSSISWRMVACLPVRMTWWMSPLRRCTSARAARICRVPWTISTSPVNTQLPEVSARLQSELADSSVIGWLRSELLARALEEARAASASTARTQAVRGLRARGRFIAGPGLGKEAVLAGLEVGFHPGAGLGDAGLGELHGLGRAAQVLRGQQLQRSGADGGRGGAGRVAVPG